VQRVPQASPSIDNPSDHYKRVEIETASPTKLLLMLYDAAIQRCESAAENMRRGELEPAHFDLLKVQDILTELMVALDFEASDAPVKELFALYDYMHRTLVQANVHKQADPVDEVAGLLSQLRRTWVEAISAPGDDEVVAVSPLSRRPNIDVQT
jgi:flagellar protein FliS